MLDAVSAKLENMETEIEYFRSFLLEDKLEFKDKNEKTYITEKCKKKRKIKIF